MKVRVPDYFEEFECIASKCEDTCCAGWGIVIDDETYKKYMSASGEFGERLRNEIVNEADENIFVLKGNDCPFLDDNKMCDIYKELGPDSLCYTCKQYPRYLEEFGRLREIGISLSCPEAARIMLRNKVKVSFKVTENDEEVNTYNEINAMLFINLMQCRKIVLDILQNRNLNIKIRAALTLIFINEVQEKIDSNKINEIKIIIDKYSRQDVIEDIIIQIGKYKNKLSVKYENMESVFLVFKDLKHINANDPLGIENVLRYFWKSEEDLDVYNNIQNRFEDYYKEDMYKFEQILVYFVFRYFMKAVYDYDVIAKIKLTIISYIMVKELAIVRYLEDNSFNDNDMVDIAHTYSKDVEHLEENIETLSEIFEVNDIFNIENMLSIIMS